MAYSPLSHVTGSSIEEDMQAEAQLSCGLTILPRSDSMDATNDPRFVSDNVIAKRLAAFQTISVVSVLMVNLSVKQLFLLQKSIDVTTTKGVIQYSGFLVMIAVFLMNLTTVVVVIQQLFMTYRLLTAGPTGFELAKAYYLNPNVVTMRHAAVKAFFFSLPLFVVSTSCMVWVTFSDSDNPRLAFPVVIFLFFAAGVLFFIHSKHQAVFRKCYHMAKAHEQPLLTAVGALETNSHRTPGRFFGIDV